VLVNAAVCHAACRRGAIGQWRHWQMRAGRECRSKGKAVLDKAGVQRARASLTFNGWTNRISDKTFPDFITKALDIRPRPRREVMAGLCHDGGRICPWLTAPAPARRCGIFTEPTTGQHPQQRNQPSVDDVFADSDEVS